MQAWSRALRVGQLPVPPTPPVWKQRGPDVKHSKKNLLLILLFAQQEVYLNGLVGRELSATLSVSWA